jgi:hypothetical protein
MSTYIHKEGKLENQKMMETSWIAANNKVF